ncbi:MAG: prolipoprotein diacylglyceryl transferase [Fimbriimonadaceae bacterium]|nr:prolipoprotein diacylglyceryl transferase [Fimbriimonadaceae bacterium]
MYPLLPFKPFGLEIHTYALLLMAGFFVGLMVARAKAARYGLTKEQVLDTSIWTLIMGVLGARVVFIVQDLPHYIKNPGEIIGKFAGLTSFGGVLFAIPTLLFFAKRFKISPWSLLDLFMVPALIGFAFGRVGCFLNGCCYGGACTLPWAIPVENSPHLHHPAQLYETIMLGVFALVVWQVEKRGQPLGRVFGLGVALMGLSRFIYEFWRAGTVEQVNSGAATSTYMPGLPITDAQLVAVLMIVGGCVVWVLRRDKRVAEEVTAS